MRPRAEQRKTPGVHSTVWEPSTFGLKNPKVVGSNPTPPPFESAGQGPPSREGFPVSRAPSLQ